MYFHRLRLQAGFLQRKNTFFSHFRFPICSFYLRKIHSHDALIFVQCGDIYIFLFRYREYPVAGKNIKMAAAKFFPPRVLKSCHRDEGARAKAFILFDTCASIRVAFDVLLAALLSTPFIAQTYSSLSLFRTLRFPYSFSHFLSIEKV